MYSQGTGEGRAELLKTSVEFHQCQSARNFFFPLVLDMLEL